MGFKITVQPVNIEFTATEEKTILEEALLAKINFPHSCKNGMCSACKCKIISGEVVMDEYNHTALNDREREDGYVLLCKSHAKSNIAIDLPGFTNGFPIRTLPVKIDLIEKIGTVAILKLRLPANQKFAFFAGQYIDVIHNGKNRSYSLANSPTDSGILELHIRYRASGAFSELVWNELKVGQILRFTGPLGSFTLKDSMHKIMMVCTGTGFAPIKAILEYMVATANQREVVLVWGNYRVDDFYLLKLIDGWRTQLNLKVQLCINEGNVSGYYTGLVTDYVAANYPDLSNYDLYACGNVAMIENMYNLAHNQLHLDKDNFFSDAFTPSIDGSI